MKASLQGWFALVSCAALPAAAATPPKPAEIPEPIRHVIELARGTAPELFANTVLNLIEAGLVPPGQPQRNLLTEAFSAAGRAAEPMRLQAAPGVGPDTRAIYRSLAGGLGLDALTLESRAITLTLKTDPSKAREMFESVGHPAIDPQACEDPLVPDASAYYRMAAELVRSGFRPKDLQDERHIQFLEAVLSGARSPGEIAAFAAALDTLALKPPELDLLLGAIAAKLESAAPYYRSFALSSDVLRSGLERLATQARNANISLAPLASGLRRYLVQQLSSPRCNEDFGDGSALVDWFNSDLRGGLAVIAKDEIQPSKRLGAFKADSYFSSEESQQLSKEFQRLRVDSNGRPLSEAERSTSEWRDLLSDFLRDFSTRIPQGSDIDVFHQKIAVLHGLFQVTPPGADRDGIIAQTVAMLRGSGVERQYAAEWLYQVKTLVEAAGTDKPALMQEFRASGDPGLALFAATAP